MVTRYTQQFLRQVEWGELDYLVLDLPPGTGDIQLTIVQTVALSGAIVETPDGLVFFKCVGPAATIQKAEKEIDELLKSMAKAGAAKA